MSSHSTTSIGSVASLWRYPVKSMLGEEIASSEVTDRGLLGDRAYALIDPATNKVVSAKNPRKWGAMFGFHAYYDEPPKIDGPPRVAWILAPDGTKLATNQANANAELSRHLGKPVMLASSAPAQPILEGYWPDHEWLESPDRTFNVEMPPGTFFDCAVVHLVTTATLSRLASLLPTSRFELRRFRPNLLINVPLEAVDGFVENDWVERTVQVGDVQLQIVSPCARCVMTTLPQGDLPKDPDVLRTVVQNNRGNVGVLAAVTRVGRIERGDAVTVI
jgi:uncharacterized protein YcbX